MKSIDNLSIVFHKENIEKSLFENVLKISGLMRKAALALTLTFVFASCSCAEKQTVAADPTADGVEINEVRNMQYLNVAGQYETGTDNSFHFTYTPDSQRARVVAEYFRIDTLLSADMTTWDRALTLATFVANNVPHLNQTKNCRRDAISIWEFVHNVEPGVNCRLHSILLSELLFSAGITNRFITCRPKSATDGDCHVVNIVWLPEADKWVMLDSDMCAYVTDSEGQVLSLREMRANVLTDSDFNIHFIKDVPFSAEYYKAYWAKNLYWFCSYVNLDFEVEAGPKNDNGFFQSLLSLFKSNLNKGVNLVPVGFDCYDVQPNSVITHDDEAFWAKPVF